MPTAAELTTGTVKERHRDRFRTIVTETTTARAISETDIDAFIVCSNASAVTLTIPGGLCWPIWRVATHERFRDGLDVILGRWTLEMVVDANDVADAFDDAAAEAAEAARRR